MSNDPYYWYVIEDKPLEEMTVEMEANNYAECTAYLREKFGDTRRRLKIVLFRNGLAHYEAPKQESKKRPPCYYIGIREILMKEGFLPVVVAYEATEQASIRERWKT